MKFHIKLRKFHRNSDNLCLSITLSLKSNSGARSSDHMCIFNKPIYPRGFRDPVSEIAQKRLFKQTKAWQIKTSHLALPLYADRT